MKYLRSKSLTASQSLEIAGIEELLASPVLAKVHSRFGASEASLPLVKSPSASSSVGQLFGGLAHARNERENR